MWKWKPWTRKEAISFLNQLEMAVLPAGAHVALGGGVLLRGQSNHDLDVIVYPRNSENGIDLTTLFDRCNSIGMSQFLNSERVHRYWREKGSTDRKEVSVWDFDGKRVDLIVVKG